MAASTLGGATPAPFNQPIGPHRRFDWLTMSLDEVQAVAIKRVLAHQLEQGMKAKQLTKTAMARRMGTTRAQLDRLLDPDNPSATLASLFKAASALGKRVKISLVNA